MTRKRGTMVDVIDLSAYGRATYEPFAYAVANGKEYVICSEGVGWEVSSEKPLIVDVTVESKDEKGTFFYWETVTIPVEKVRELVTGETVDLADHIRTFGSRLDTNHYIWRTTLSEGK